MSKKRNRKLNKKAIKFKKDLKEMAEWCELQNEIIKLNRGGINDV